MTSEIRHALKRLTLGMIVNFPITGLCFVVNFEKIGVQKYKILFIDRMGTYFQQQTVIDVFYRWVVNC